VREQGSGRPCAAVGGDAVIYPVTGHPRRARAAAATVDHAVARLGPDDETYLASDRRA
jgi:hypothetical protein